MNVSRKSLEASSAEQVDRLRDEAWQRARLRHHLAIHALIPRITGEPSTLRRRRLIL